MEGLLPGKAWCPFTWKDCLPVSLVSVLGLLGG